MRRTAQDEHTEPERSVEQLRDDQVTGGGVRSNLEEDMELLFAETDALRQERATGGCNMRKCNTGCSA